jgi:hypothetical protein
MDLADIRTIRQLLSLSSILFKLLRSLYEGN